MAAEREIIDVEVHLTPMRRRHLRGVVRIESQVYPRPWSHSLFVSEIALRSSRSYAFTFGPCTTGRSGPTARSAAWREMREPRSNG